MSARAPDLATRLRRRRYEVGEALSTSNLGGAFRLVVVPLTVLALVSAVVAAAFGEFAHLTLPLLALVIVSYPIIHDRNYDIVSPWTLVWFATLMGGPVRGIYIVLEWPDFGTINYLFLRGQDDSFFIGPTVIILLGLASFAYGFSIRSRGAGTRLPRLLRGGSWDPQRMWFVVAGLVVLSLVSLMSFVSQLGGFDPTNVSGKRGVLTGLDIDQNYQSFYHLRILNDFGMLAALVVLAYYAFSSKRLTPMRVALVGALFVNGTLLSLWASSRKSVLFPATSALVIWLLAGRAVKIRTLLIVALSGLLIFQAMSFARKARDESFGDVVAVAVDLRHSLDPIVVNRGFLSLTTSAHVIDAIPDRLEYAYGETLAVPLLAPVPRFLWKDKPVVNAGPRVGALVFNQENGAGNPPGMIAELYWNFSFIGVVLGGLGIGFLSRRLYETMRPYAGRRNMAVLYAVAVLPLPYTILTGEITKSVTAMVIDMVQVVIVLALISSARGRRRVRA